MSAPGRFPLRELRLAMAAPAPVAGLASRWSTVEGLRTHHRASTGPASGVPVVLLHGLAVSHRYLVPTALALAPAHPVLLPDLPGFGLTERPGRAYDVGEHAAHVRAWLAALGVGPVCLLGHSFGAQVAAQAACSYPELVCALVLGGPTADPAARTRAGQVARFARNLVGEDPRQAPILARDVRDAGPGRVWATVGESVRHRVEVAVAAVRAPVLVVGGGRDRIAPAAWRRRLAALAPVGREVTVPRAAHNAATTAGAEVADAVTAFLADIAPPP